MDYVDYEAGAGEGIFWFRAKNGLIEAMMKRLNRKGMKILNLGAGTGSDLKILGKYGKVYCVDIDRRALKMVPEGLCAEKKLADICSLPYKDNSFDLVVSFDVFEHIKEDTKAAGEAHRVLKKGGILLFTVPAFKFLFSARDRALGHRRRYGKKELEKMLRHFSKVRMNYWNCLLFLPIAAMRLAKKRAKPGMDFFEMPKIMDSALYAVLAFENKIISLGLPLPFGVSIAGSCEK